jgi:hypothetical protein
MPSSFRRSAGIVCLLTAFLIGFVASARLARAQQTLTVAKLEEFIKSSIQQKLADKDVATYTAKIKMSEKLSPKVVEDLQSAGAGPKTVAALTILVTQSASLGSAPAKMVMTTQPPSGPPPPSDAEKKRILEDTRQWALNYVKSLPDFLCMEVTRRSVDPHFEIGSEGSWSPEDRLIEKLTYFDHKENYELLQHNDTALIGKTWETLGGSISRGEWATLLAEIFEPSTRTDFRWQRWGTLRGHLTDVYEYTVRQENSQETIAYGDAPDNQKITAGFHGLLYVQNSPENVVLRLTVIPDIPASFPVQDVDQTVDYDFQDIGTTRFLLPLHSQVKMRNGHIASMNEIEWRQYRKYSADTSISFDTTDDKPLSDDKTKEQQAGQTPAKK